MDEDIKIILKTKSDRKIIQLILEQMESYEISKIRQKIEPHWDDNMYSNWSHVDPLFDLVFSEEFEKIIEITDYYGDDVYEPIKHRICLLCDEEIMTDKTVHDYRYSHLFSDCRISKQIMKKVNNESEYRINVEKQILENKTKWKY